MKSISVFYISIIVMIGNSLLFGSIFSMDKKDRKLVIIENKCDKNVTVRYEPRHVAMNPGTYIVTTVAPGKHIKLLPLFSPHLTFKIEAFEKKKDLSIVRMDLPVTVTHGIDGSIKIMQENEILGEMKRRMESVSSFPEKMGEDKKLKDEKENCSIM